MDNTSSSNILYTTRGSDFFPPQIVAVPVVGEPFICPESEMNGLIKFLPEAQEVAFWGDFNDIENRFTRADSEQMLDMVAQGIFPLPMVSWRELNEDTLIPEDN